MLPDEIHQAMLRDLLPDEIHQGTPPDTRIPALPDELHQGTALRHTTAANPSSSSRGFSDKRQKIETILEAVFDANGAIGFFQDMAVL